MADTDAINDKAVIEVEKPEKKDSIINEIQMEEISGEQTIQDQSSQYAQDLEEEYYEDTDNQRTKLVNAPESPEDDDAIKKEKRRQERNMKRAARLEIQKKLPAGQLSPEKITATASLNFSEVSKTTLVKTVSEISKRSITSMQQRRNRSTMLLDDSYNAMLMEAVMEEESDSMESFKSKTDYCTVQYKDDFLNYFEDLPSLSELSSIDTMLTSIHRDTSMVQPEDEAETEDIGKFVDPLTGNTIESSSSESTETDEFVELEFGEEGEGLDAIDIISLKSLTETTEKPPVIYEDNLIQFEIEQKSDEVFQLVETPAQILARQMLQIAHEFLSELIDDVAKTAELRSEKVKLATSVDRNKLYKALTDTLTELQNAKYANSELTQKIYEFYKRRKVIRYIIPLPYEEEIREQKNYESNLKCYDHLLEKQRYYKEFHDEQRALLAKKIKDNQKLAIESEQNLEDTVRETFADHKYDNYRSQIENYLMKLKRKFNDISTIRLTLIQRQHTEATLLEKLDALEKINANLQMNTFISTHTKVVATQKKIEERNNDFNRLRSSCNTEIVTSAHYREMIDILQRTINSKNIEQKKLFDLHREKREYLYKLKIDHGRNRKLIKEKSFQGGLLERTVLMHDFDDTVDAIQALQKKIKNMRDNVKAITLKVEIAEKQLFVSKSNYSK